MQNVKICPIRFILVLPMDKNHPSPFWSSNSTPTLSSTNMETSRRTVVSCVFSLPHWMSFRLMMSVGLTQSDSEGAWLWPYIHTIAPEYSLKRWVRVVPAKTRIILSSNATEHAIIFILIVSFSYFFFLCPPPSIQFGFHLLSPALCSIPCCANCRVSKAKATGAACP